MSHLTIAYSTTRKDPRFDWFFYSLWRECRGNYDGIKIVIVDLHAKGRENTHSLFPSGNVCHVTPKPSVWQGDFRLTKEDCFAASNARNTALCLAPDGWLAYVDDLSVLMPGWLNSVREAMAAGYMVFGSYRKVNKLMVENGEVRSFEPMGNTDSRCPSGTDTRLQYVKQDVTPCGGEWLYGCCLAGKVGDFLSVNGWPENLTDGMGFEDCIMGMALQNVGIPMRFDKRMFTYESNELHFIDPPLRRDDWHFESGKPVRGGNGGSDKSHAALEIAKQSKRFPNHFDIRELRDRTLRGEPFPVDLNPQHDWYTKLHLSEL